MGLSLGGEGKAQGGTGRVRTRGAGLYSTYEKVSQLIKRFCPPYIRDVLRRFRVGDLAAKDAWAELNLSRARFYKI